MPTRSSRRQAKSIAISRGVKFFELPSHADGTPLRVSEYFGENVFDIAKALDIPEHVRRELMRISKSREPITKEQAEIVANAVTRWATHRGCTHFCHWFQPLTGGTAEKHDAFLSFDHGKPIEKLSSSQLLQGEPDASSFPHGGSRSTFEARGYTSWDLTSPMFIAEGPNGNTLCIPTGFVSYTGEALDVKTPLLRSVSYLSKQATRFLNLVNGNKVSEVKVTVGCEQEYFLIDREFYYNRPDLVMTGRTLLGSGSAKNQQLEDHYFGTIPDRVISFMQELDTELYKLGIPAKTRHNEVAPSQYEIAPIFGEANVAADQNQMLMATLKRVATKHNFEAILHEKPFSGINGSGKHVNWSMSDDHGRNLLEPGDSPEKNLQFVAVLSMVLEAVFRHSEALRMSIASASNDHRLGANEAPPAIMSVFLGHTLDQIVTQIRDGKTPTLGHTEPFLEVGTEQLAQLLKDNTDRNRTSPFAFTGNKFEFRAVGSSMAVGFPIGVLNAAVADVFKDSADYLEELLAKGKSIDEGLRLVAQKWIAHAQNVIFNGDGYSKEWEKEAARRGLPNFKSTPEALKVYLNSGKTAFLTESNIFRQSELAMRFNAACERYITLREIEFRTLISLVNQTVIPAALAYKQDLARSIKNQKDLNIDCKVDVALLKKSNELINEAFELVSSLSDELHGERLDHDKHATHIAEHLLPISVKLSDICAAIEEIVPNHLWPLPKAREMLFLR